MALADEMRASLTSTLEAALDEEVGERIAPEVIVDVEECTDAPTLKLKGEPGSATDVSHNATMAHVAERSPQQASTFPSAAETTEIISSSRTPPSRRSTSQPSSRRRSRLRRWHWRT